MSKPRHQIGTNVAAQLRHERMSESEKFAVALRAWRKFTLDFGGRDECGLPVIAFELIFPISGN